MSWNDEQIETLKKLAAEGLSSGQIGKAIGKTRNAVIGKCHRIGVKLKGKPDYKKISEEVKETVNRRVFTPPKSIKPHPKSERITLPKREVEPMIEWKPTPKEEPKYDPKIKPVSLLDRKPNTCCYVVTDEKPHLYCGQGITNNLRSLPYCKAHYDIMYREVKRT